jgi:hypothetical protein
VRGERETASEVHIADQGGLGEGVLAQPEVDDSSGGRDERGGDEALHFGEALVEELLEVGDRESWAGRAGVRVTAGGGVPLALAGVYGMGRLLWSFQRKAIWCQSGRWRTCCRVPSVARSVSCPRRVGVALPLITLVHLHEPGLPLQEQLADPRGEPFHLLLSRDLKRGGGGEARRGEGNLQRIAIAALIWSGGGGGRGGSWLPDLVRKGREGGRGLTLQSPEKRCGAEEWRPPRRQMHPLP